MKLQTKHKIISEIKKVDPDTDLTVAVLEYLAKEEDVRTYKRGNRTYYDYDTLAFDLNELLGFKDSFTMPRVRTVNNAHHYAFNLGMGISRDAMYSMSQKQIIASIKCNNRCYIALENFEKSNEKVLFDCLLKSQGYGYGSNYYSNDYSRGYKYA